MTGVEVQPGRRDELVVICATTYWHGTRLLDQHMALELSRYAHVLYVDPPTSVLTHLRNPEAALGGRSEALEVVSPGVRLLRPRVLPLKERRGGKHLALALTRRQLRAAVRAMGSPRVRALVVPSLNPYFGTLDEECSVFYVKDDYLAGAGLMGVAPRRLRRRTVQQPRDADLVVAVSQELVAKLASEGVTASLIPNGCTVEDFAAAGEPPPPPQEAVVGFVGHLSDRVDVALLEAVARRGVRLRLIGARQQTLSGGGFGSLLAMANVEWTGPVPYHELGDHLSDVTTCLLPYADEAFNRASFPLKILEYLAAGRRVVATDLPAVRWLDTPLVTIARPEDFADSVVESLATPLCAPEIASRRAFAQEHSWARRGEELASLIGIGHRQVATP